MVVNFNFFIYREGVLCFGVLYFVWIKLKVFVAKNRVLLFFFVVILCLVFMLFVVLIVRSKDFIFIVIFVIDVWSFRFYRVLRKFFFRLWFRLLSSMRKR